MSQSAQPQYAFGEFVVCPQTLSISASGEIRHLRSKSFATLLYLLQNRDRVVAKQELIDAVWEGIAVTDDVLVGCVGEIRKVLSDSKDGALIRTVPKTGYQFVAPVEEVQPTKSVIAEPVTVQDPESALPRLPGRLIPILGAALALLVAVVLLWRFWPRPVVEVGFWPLAPPRDGLVADISGNGNDGKVHGQIHNLDSGPLGRGLRFDGQGFVSAEGRVKGFPSGDQAFSITAWVRAHPGDSLGPIVHLGPSSGHIPRSDVHLYLTEQGMACLGWGRGYGSACGTRPLNDNQWHHLVGIYSPDEDFLVLYVDGEEYARLVPSDKARIGRPARWMIGSFLTGGVPFTGDLADVRIFRGRMTHPQAEALRECALSGLIRLPRVERSYFLPLYRATIERKVDPASGEVKLAYNGFGKGGIEFAQSDGVCALQSLRGAAMPQDLRMGFDIFLPPETEGGPFFRARQVKPGDPIEARGAGGVWVRLASDGRIRVFSLSHPEESNDEPVAQGVVTGMRPNQWQHIEVQVQANILRIWEGGAPVRLRTAQGDVNSLPVPPGDRAAGIGVVAPARPTDSIVLRRIEVADPPRF